ncbi:MAG: hypothetical protein ACKOHM_02300 [Spartobacteria bacterium]
MKNPMLARPVPGLAAFLRAHFQASLKMALQNSLTLRANLRLLFLAPAQALGCG